MNQALRDAEQLRMRPYTGYGAARQLWTCRDDEILMDGPAGTGKTRAILEKMHYCAMKYKGFRGALIRKTRESMTESVLVTFEEKVVPESSEILDGPQRNLRQKYYYPTTGAYVVVGGMDKASKVMSTEYDMIGTFESTELTEEDFENLTTRLRNGRMEYQQIMSDCNPGNPHHWLNKRAQKGLMTRLLSRHEDNPVLFDQKRRIWTPAGIKYIARLDRLTGARKLRLRHGLWVAAEGTVYEMWDEDKHMIDKRAVPSHWRKIRVIDFGFKNPFVCLWIAVDDDGDMIVYRQIYMTRKLVADHAVLINKYSEGEHYEATIADHDAEDRETLHQAGIFTIPAHKAILPGIEAVSARLRHDNGQEPGLYIMRDSLVETDTALEAVGLPTKTEHEFDSYMYPKDQDGKPIKEEPVKKEDHGMDCLRYGVAYIDNIAGMTIKVEAAETSAVYVN